MANKNYEKAVAALMASPTTKEAAKAMGVGESTLRAYKSDPEFKEMYTAARHELLAAGVQSLQVRFSEAVDTVCEVMRDGSVSPSVRLSAANSVIQNCVRLTEDTERMARADESRRCMKDFLMFPIGE